MKKRLWSMLLVVAICLTMLPVTALAADAADAWDGTSDTSWYNAFDNEFHLTTAEQLAGLAELVNNGNTFSGKTILLGNSLNLSGHEWTSIGTGNNFSNYFGGTFDGQNFQISSLTSRNSQTYYHGLFGVISSGGTVKNLYIVDADLYSNDTSLRMGILADWINNGIAENCYTSGTVHNVSGDELLGGLVGTCTAGSKIIGCSSDAAVISDYYDGVGRSYCDTVGGIVGQWENATDDAVISDCWFGGSISCGFDDSAVGGILGANFDFYDNQPGVDIRNCVVATKEITCKEPGNITWIAAVVNGTVENCWWPDSPPDGVELTPDEYESYNGTYLAVVKLVVDWSTSTAGPDSNFDQSACGKAVSDFTASDILTNLQTKAYTGVSWVAGTEHPVFQQQAIILNLNDAISKITQKEGWTVKQADANDAEQVKSIIETELNQMNLDATVTVTVDSITPAADGKNGSFTFAAELRKDGISRSVIVTEGVILATPLPQAAPDFAPELNSRTTSSITLNTVQDTNENNAAVEYGISSDGGITWNWQSSPEFTNLSSGTTYMFALRYGAVTGNISYSASENGPTINLSTNRSSSGGGSSTPTYPPSITKPDNGDVTVSPTSPKQGDTVTITPKPEEGYEVDKITVTDSNGKQVEIKDNGDGTYSFTQPSGKVTITVTFKATGCPKDSTCPISKFTDASATAWYHDGVHYVLDEGLMFGIGDNKFAPNATLTRAELAQILYNKAGKPAVTGLSTFTDVPASAWYAKAVAWAQQNNIVSGIGGNKFAPNQIVTREQIAVMLYNEAGRPAVSGTITGFADAASVSAWAQDAVLWAIQNMVINGAQKPDGTLLLNPTSGATRAETAALLNNYYN